jgi:hypothetical protein
MLKMVLQGVCLENDPQAGRSCKLLCVGFGLLVVWTVHVHFIPTRVALIAWGQQQQAEMQ